MIALEYIGDGRFIANVPARDLTEAEVKLWGGKRKLIDTGLYREPRPVKRLEVTPKNSN